jgi:hypothetical protein
MLRGSAGGLRRQALQYRQRARRRHGGVAEPEKLIMPTSSFMLNVAAIMLQHNRADVAVAFLRSALRLANRECDKRRVACIMRALNHARRV